jgi:hypothetical protein
MMRTGRVKARKIHDAMPWIGYGRQTDDDLKAIFAYLRTLTPVPHRVDNSLPPRIVRAAASVMAPTTRISRRRTKITA